MAASDTACSIDHQESYQTHQGYGPETVKSHDSSQKDIICSISPVSGSDTVRPRPVIKLGGNLEDPKSWPIWKRIFNTAVPALSIFIITLSTSAYIPAVPYVQVRFGVSQEIAVLPLSLYTLGLAFGPVVTGPLSEVFGRRIIYQLTLPLLIIFQLGAAFSNSVVTLIILRFMAGFGGSAALCVCGGTVVDIWDMQRGGGIASLVVILAGFLGPSLGPVTGAYAVADRCDDWRWGLLITVCLASPVFLVSLFISESSEKQILMAKNKRLGNYIDRPTLSEVGQVVCTAVCRPTCLLLTEPLVAVLSLYTGLAFAILFSFFGSFPYIFQVVYRFNPKHTGLAFLSILVGFMLAIITFVVFDKTIYARESRKVNGRLPAPEHRLYTAMLGSVLLPASLFWFAWTARPEIHWIVPIAAGVPFGWATFGIFISVTVFLVDLFSCTAAASALAANGVLRYLMGAIFPLFVIQVYEYLGIHWAGSLFAFAALAMMPVPWLVYVYGPQLRVRSQYVP